MQFFFTPVLHAQYLMVSPEPRGEGRLLVRSAFAMDATSVQQVYAHARKGEPAALYIGVVFRHGKQWCAIDSQGLFWASFARTRQGAVDYLKGRYFV